ncbi:hypothetical protein DM02DRAFT_706084 [Periconia macrospinosa]|uniref:Protein kinase domain-containing protein n=1 Tax=Periconia macrospinosa TaxID=97972 RepID=A0A2V1DTP2_9PLEO|nr:hypothetical protein DM02DRAFT_706084 [Periconia macrospinosa]
MSSTFQSSSWPVIATSIDTSVTQPTASPALDLLATIATADVQQYTLSDIGIYDMENVRSMDERQIGRGGFAVVELGTMKKNRVVAIKRMRISGKDMDADFGVHLRHLCLELRILCHEPLKQHPNVINIDGYCLSEVVGLKIPFLALVLEYSSEGHLNAFLRANQDRLSVTARMNLVAQVAEGLAALHQCNICHGDVKTQNALVFQTGDTWAVKISDFGNSIVGLADDHSSSVQRGFGTRLMDAPEIRDTTRSSDTHFSFQDAVRTDIFSFGLLLWEVLKQGSNYFEKEWCAQKGSIDVDEMEEYLMKLPQNGLLCKACDYAKSSVHSTEISEMVLWTFRSSLQDDPMRRRSMKEIVEYLGSQNTYISNTHDHSQPDALVYEPLCAWSTQATLFEEQLQIHAYANGLGLIHIPFQFQKHVVHELTPMSESESVDIHARAHAALCVAECYALGFGVTQDTKQIVQWIYRASELGSPKATAWYPRACSANAIPPIRSSHLQVSFGLEEQLAHVASDAYLSSRIRLQIRTTMQHVKSTILGPNHLLLSEKSESILRLGLFNSWEVDDLSPLHVAALLGDNTFLSSILPGQEGNDLSSHRFTPIHYACIGGHLSTLELLLRHFTNPNTHDFRGITPLHLCIFFAENDAEKAAALLLNSGSDAHAEVLRPVHWEYHDISLVGTALHWATRTRHNCLVRSLLPFTEDDTCLKIATRNFFWDIAEVILQYSREYSNVPVKSSAELSELIIDDQYLHTLDSPFSHWVSHGPDHLMAMEKMVKICLNSHIVAGGNSQTVAFKDLVSSATFEDDFWLIEFCAAQFPPEYIKRTDENGSSALECALGASGNSLLWRKPLESIISAYTIEELHSGSGSIYMTDQSYLHYAIVSDSIVGAELLLEKGMDANQRQFGVLGESPLSMAGLSKYSEELSSLLVKHGAKDDVTFEFTGENQLVQNSLRSRPNKELTKIVFQNDDSPYIGEALHDTLNFVIFGLLKSRDVEEEPEMKCIKLGKDDLEVMWAQLRDLTAEKSSNLEFFLGKDQLNSLLAYMTLDHDKRPTSLSLIVEAEHFPNQEDAAAGSNSQELPPAEDSFGGHGDLHPRDIGLDLDPDNQHQYWMELFKMQLSLDNWAKSINHTDRMGMTLIQKAAYHLHLESVTLLLESGADASLPIVFEGTVAMLPLQIACAVGRACNGAKLMGRHPALVAMGKKAMSVAFELLKWHHLRLDGLFQGITKAHLASRMLPPGSLTDVSLPDGYDKTGKGHWPGIKNAVGCESLTAHIADDEWFEEFNVQQRNWPLNRLA